MIDEPRGPKPAGAVWRPCRDLSGDQFGLKHESARHEARQWKEARARLEDSGAGREVMDIWLAEQNRSFAIETGQIEGLYHLRKGVAETLITEGFEGVRGAHSATAITDETLKGLLQDQEAALEMLYAHAEEVRPLTAAAIREWHQLLTRHQGTAPGIDLYGRRVEIPLRRGAWKIRPNNPRRDDGFVHDTARERSQPLPALSGRLQTRAGLISATSQQRFDGDVLVQILPVQAVAGIADSEILPLFGACAHQPRKPRQRHSKRTAVIQIDPHRIAVKRNRFCSNGNAHAKPFRFPFGAG